MKHLEILSLKDREINKLKERLRLLEGRKAGIDNYSKEYRLLTQEVSELRADMAAKELELQQYVENFN